MDLTAIALALVRQRAILCRSCAGCSSVSGPSAAEHLRMQLAAGIPVDIISVLAGSYPGIYSGTSNYSHNLSVENSQGLGEEEELHCS
jgi:hypothetical protein